MNESLLHFIWKFRLFDQLHLKTTGGDRVEVISTGTHNTDAGADFQQAKIKIADTLWAGNVEMHINSDDWFAHAHHTDAAYNNVILHVVWSAGKQTATRQNGTPIPTAELKHLVHPHTISRYQMLLKQQHWVPCAKFYGSTDAFTRSNMLDKLLVERLQGKVLLINQLLKESGNDWENVLYQLVAKYLGAGINREPLMAVAKSLPVKIRAKHYADKLQVEALVFGQAGLLQEKFDDDYPNQLRREYLYLKRLHGLQPIDKTMWKFLRLRPANFPTIRLAQLAALMGKEVKLFSAVKESKTIKALHQLLDVNVSPYWQTHYTFSKSSKQVKWRAGTATKNIILINAIAPLLFAYGKHKDDEAYCERAIQLLADIKPEANSIITGWKKLGQEASNAADTQALLQLKNEYCNRFRCLECSIGIKILH